MWPDEPPDFKRLWRADEEAIRNLAREPTCRRRRLVLGLCICLSFLAFLVWGFVKSFATAISGDNRMWVLVILVGPMCILGARPTLLLTWEGLLFLLGRPSRISEEIENQERKTDNKSVDSTR